MRALALALLLPFQLGIGNDELLFRHLATQTTFPYTLIGSKPMSFEVLPLSYDMLEKDFIHYPNLGILNFYWQRWISTNGEVDNNRFVLRQAEKGWIYLINKKRCLEVVSENFDLFEHLGSDPNAVCDGLFKAPSIIDFLKRNERLYGILLGFGRDNAGAYDQKHNALTEPKTPLQFFNGEDPNNFCFYAQPGFMAIESDETKSLRQDYERDQRAVVDAFTGRAAEEVFMEYLGGT